MSAPVSRDPLVVNTQDGACWVRRATTREGRGLYAVADAPACCPEFVMATLAELAEHGLASMADALPMPVGSELRTLDQVEDELTGVSLSLHEEELETARLRLALKSAQRGRREARVRVVELEAERHTTNEALDDAVQELRTREADGITRRIAPTQTFREDGVYPQGTAQRVQQRGPEAADDVTPQVQKLRGILAVQRAALEDQHDSPLHHDYRVGRDLPETGGTR